MRLGGDDHLVARHVRNGLADDGLGPIGGGGIEQVDAEIKRRAHDANGIRLAAAGAETEPAEPTASEARDADTQAGAPEDHGVHAGQPGRARTRRPGRAPVSAPFSKIGTPETIVAA